MTNIAKENPIFKMGELSAKDFTRELCRDFYSGGAIVLGERDQTYTTHKYIVKHPQESDAEYKFRVKNAPFLNLFTPAINTIIDLTTRDNVYVSGFKYFDFKNVDLKGTTLNEFMRQAILDSLLDGGSFIAVHTTLNGQKTQIYLKLYKYEQLQNFSISPDDSKPHHFTFKEAVAKINGYKMTYRNRYNVYYRNGGESWIENKSGDYSKTTWGKNEKSFDAPPILFLKTGTNYQPIKDGAFFNISGDVGVKYYVIPRFYDLANINCSILNYESVLCSVFPKLTQPLLLIYGTAPLNDNVFNREELNAEGEVKITENVKIVGKNKGLSFEDKTTQGAEWAEMKGHGIKHIENRIESLKKDANLMTLNIFRQDSLVSISNVEAEDLKAKGTTFINVLKTEVNKVLHELGNILSQVTMKPIGKDDIIEYKTNIEDSANLLKNLNILQELANNNKLSGETMLKIVQDNKLLSKDILDVEKDYDKEFKRLEKEAKINNQNTDKKNIKKENKNENKKNVK